MKENINEEMGNCRIRKKGGMVEVNYGRGEMWNMEELKKRISRKRKAVTVREKMGKYTDRD